MTAPSELYCMLPMPWLLLVHVFAIYGLALLLMDFVEDGIAFWDRVLRPRRKDRVRRHDRHEW